MNRAEAGSGAGAASGGLPAMMAADSALILRGIRKSFWVPHVPTPPTTAPDPRRRRQGRRDRLDALAGIDLSVPAGQTLGLIGPNGSGKTTLLKIIAGVMHADGGEVAARGRIGALLEVGAGFHPELSGEENIHLNGALLGLSREQMRRHLGEIIAFAELERFMDMPVKHYSSGMIVRLGFATAIQLRPDILLLDETFAVGDARFQTRALAAIRRLKGEGVTMILVSHNAELILELADRAVWLDHGCIRMDDLPNRTLAAYRRTAGAAALEGARTGSRLIASAVSRERSENRSGLRLISLALLPPTPAESDDRLELRAEMEAAEAIAADMYDFIVWFKRDDRRVIAEARLPVPSRPAGSSRLELSFDPLGLGRGQYEIAMAVVLRNSTDPHQTVDRLDAAEPLSIRTPPPGGFRVAGEIKARWEAAGSGGEEASVHPRESASS